MSKYNATAAAAVGVELWALFAVACNKKCRTGMGRKGYQWEEEVCGVDRVDARNI